MHGIKVLMAKNYIDNLAEETVKGMTEKARAGIYPSFAPVGYRNADGPSGKRVIVPDPETAPIIAELFSRFATGTFSLRTHVARFRAEGVTLRGRKLHTSTVHQILEKASLYRRFRLGREDIPRYARAAGDPRMLGASSRAIGYPRREQDQKSEARVWICRISALRSLWMSHGRRNQEGSLRLLPLHG